MTSLSFMPADVNNFVVGSEEGAVHAACRHGRFVCKVVLILCNDGIVCEPMASNLRLLSTDYRLSVVDRIHFSDYVLCILLQQSGR